MLKKAVFMTNGVGNIPNVYPEEIQNRLRAQVELLPGIVTESDLEARRDELKEVEVLFSTWGMLPLTEEQIKTYLPKLQYVFYAAGSVQYFARPFLNLGIKVFSAWAANAVPVAEYAVAQIVLAGKGFFQSARRYYRQDRAAAAAFTAGQPCNYGIRVGLIGAGMIGKMVAERLQDYEYEVLVYDPFVSDETLAALGAKRAELAEIFATCQIISNHVANLPSTVGMINAQLLHSMLPNATFINTGRGAQVDENALIQAMIDEPDRTAVLDVTFPEPPVEGSPLLTLPNIFMTPHIAGSLGKEVARMGKYMAIECEKTLAGQPTQYEVTLKMLETMA